MCCVPYCLDGGLEARILTHQYRMHAVVANLIGKMFYEGKLITPSEAGAR